MRRRIIGLLAALLLAGFGTVVLVSYVQGASDRASAGQELVEVLVVTAPVDAGTPAADLSASTELRRVPLSTRAAGAVGDLSDLGDLVTAVDLVTGEQVVAARFVDPSSVEPVREGVPIPFVEIPAGHVEVSFSIEPQRMLGGLLAPGDRVMVVASFDAVPIDVTRVETVTINGSIFALPDEVTGDADGDTASSGPQAVSATRVIMPGALITRIQADTVPELVSAEDGGTPTLLVPTGNFNVTLAVDPVDLEKVVFAKEYGTLWLAYQPSDVTTAPATPGQTFGTIFAGIPTPGDER